MPQSNPQIRLVTNQESRQEMTDDDLMALVRLSESRAFEELVRRHQAVVLGFSSRFLCDRQLAKEATQEVFLTLWQQRKKYRPQGLFRNFLLAIAYNRCRALVRKRSQQSKLKDRVERLQQQPEQSQSPLQQLLRERQSDLIRQQLAELPAKIRQLLILRFFLGCSLKEISQTTGLPEGTVKSHLSRSVKRLHKTMGEDIL